MGARLPMWRIHIQAHSHSIVWFGLDRSSNSAPILNQGSDLQTARVSPRDLRLDRRGERLHNRRRCYLVVPFLEFDDVFEAHQIVELAERKEIYTTGLRVSILLQGTVNRIQRIAGREEAGGREYGNSVSQIC